MEEFSASLNEFLAFRKYEILEDKGKVSKKMADSKAEVEYAEFNKQQKITSDFDLEVQRLLKKGSKIKSKLPEGTAADLVDSRGRFS